MKYPGESLYNPKELKEILSSMGDIVRIGDFKFDREYVKNRIAYLEYCNINCVGDS